MDRGGGEVGEFGIVVDQGPVDIGDPAMNLTYEIGVVDHEEEDVFAKELHRSGDESANGGASGGVPEVGWNDAVVGFRLLEFSDLSVEAFDERRLEERLNRRQFFGVVEQRLQRADRNVGVLVGVAEEVGSRRQSDDQVGLNAAQLMPSSKVYS